MGKSTISMAIFNSKLLNYQRVPGRLAGPGLRGGLLGHATPGGELAGAEATAGGGEVGRNSHAGAMAGRMGVGWCLGLGLVVGEGNINGNIWKYMEILRWTFVNLWAFCRKLCGRTVMHGFAYWRWRMTEMGDLLSTRTHVTGPPIGGDFLSRWKRTFCAYMCRPFVICSNKFVLTLFSIDFKFDVQYKICSIFQ